MPLFGWGKSEPSDYDREKFEKEVALLSNINRGTQIGEFVVVCKTDYVQTFSDPWIAHFEYHWTEYLMLTQNLLHKPDDLSTLVYLPSDLGEVYYVVVPSESPDFRHLTPRGRMDYEYVQGYEDAVSHALRKDYAAIPKRSLFHSVTPQASNWDMVVDDVLSRRKESVVIEYNGSRYNFFAPRDKKEAEASAFQAMGIRRGAYPMEESLVADRKFDIVPSLPANVTGRITVREFASDPKEKPPFERLSFQRTEIPANAVPVGHPTIMNDISLGDELEPNESLANHLETKYVQLSIQEPTVKIVGYY